jgi:hypothetical protein
MSASSSLIETTVSSSTTDTDTSSGIIVTAATYPTTVVSVGVDGFDRLPKSVWAHISTFGSYYCSVTVKPIIAASILCTSHRLRETVRSAPIHLSVLRLPPTNSLHWRPSTTHHHHHDTIDDDGSHTVDLHHSSTTTNSVDTALNRSSNDSKHESPDSMLIPALKWFRAIQSIDFELVGSSVPLTLKQVNHLPLKQLTITDDITMDDFASLFTLYPSLHHITLESYTDYDAHYQALSEIAGKHLSRIDGATFNGGGFGPCRLCNARPTDDDDDGDESTPPPVIVHFERCHAKDECHINEMKLCSRCAVRRPCHGRCRQLYHWSSNDPTKRCAPSFDCDTCSKLLTSSLIDTIKASIVTNSDIKEIAVTASTTATLSSSSSESSVTAMNMQTPNLIEIGGPTCGRECISCTVTGCTNRICRDHSYFCRSCLDNMCHDHATPCVRCNHRYICPSCYQQAVMTMNASSVWLCQHCDPNE